MANNTEIQQALETYFKNNNVPVTGDSYGEYSFMIEIDEQRFSELKTNEVFADADAEDSIAGPLAIDCYTLTSASKSVNMPEGTLAFFAELPVAQFNDNDYYLLLSVVNEFNSDGILGGGLFVDQDEKAVFYRHSIRLTGTDAIEVAIDDFFERTVSELVYSMQGFRIFERKLGEVNSKIREERRGKVVKLFSDH